MNISACAVIAAPFIQYASLEPYNRNVLRYVSAEAILYYNPYCSTLPLVLRPTLCYCNSPYCTAVFPVNHIPSCTLVVLQSSWNYNQHCVTVPTIIQSLLYGNGFCTTSPLVQKSLLYGNRFCTTVPLVRQRSLYNSPSCTTFSLVQQRNLYNSPSRTTVHIVLQRLFVQQSLLYCNGVCTTIPLVRQRSFYYSRAYLLY